MNIQSPSFQILPSNPPPLDPQLRNVILQSSVVPLQDQNLQLIGEGNAMQRDQVALQNVTASVDKSMAHSIVSQLREHPDSAILGEATDLDRVWENVEQQIENGDTKDIGSFVKVMNTQWNEISRASELNFWTQSAWERIYSTFVSLVQTMTGSYLTSISTQNMLTPLQTMSSSSSHSFFLPESFPAPIGNLKSPHQTLQHGIDLAVFTDPLNDPMSFSDTNYNVPVYPNAMIDPRQQMSHEEKKKLRDDLVSLPKHMLGEVMFVLRQAQPQNVGIEGDQLVLDIKKLNNRTLLHLQAYVRSMESNLLQQELNTNGQVADPENRGDEAQDVTHPQRKRPRKRKRTHQRNSRPRKKRTSYTVAQKQAMIKFWADRSWQPIAEDEEGLEPFASSIGVTSEQVRVFRQNNRKKYSALLPI